MKIEFRRICERCEKGIKKFNEKKMSSEVSLSYL